MPETIYDVVGNPTQAQEQQSDEIFSAGDMEAINTVAGNIEDVISVAENGESWATRAENAANAAEATAASLIAVLTVVDLAGGTYGNKTGIAAAWAALSAPTPLDNELVYARYAGLVCLLVTRASAGSSDGAWEVVAGAGGAGTVTEPPSTPENVVYGRVTGAWFQVVTSVQGLTGNITTLGINHLADVNTATNPPAVNDRLVWDGTNWVPQTPTNAVPEAPGDGAIYARQGPDGGGVGVPASWIAAAPVGHNHYLAGLLDYDGATPATEGQILRYVSGKWKPSNESAGAPALNDLTDVNTTGVAEGMTLVYRSGVWVDEAPAGSTGKQAINTSKLVGPVTHDVVAGDAINQLSVDLTAGDVTVRWDDNLTHGAAERLQGQILIEAVGSGALKFASVLGTALIPPEDPITGQKVGFQNRNSTTADIGAGDVAWSSTSPNPVSVPAGDDQVLVAIVLGNIRSAATYNGTPPRLKIGSTYYDHTSPYYVGGVAPATSAGSEICVGAWVWVIPLGNLAVSTDYTLGVNVAATQFNGIGLCAFPVASVDQTTRTEGWTGTANENAGSTPTSFAPSVTTAGVNRMVITFAAKASNTGTGTADGTGDNWTATGATEVQEIRPGASATTAATGIVAYEIAAAAGAHAATLAHGVAAKNALYGGFALRPVSGAGAPKITLYNAADVSDLGRMVGWQYDKNAAKCWIVR